MTRQTTYMEHISPSKTRSRYTWNVIARIIDICHMLKMPITIDVLESLSNDDNYMILYYAIYDMYNTKYKYKNIFTFKDILYYIERASLNPTPYDVVALQESLSKIAWPKEHD